MISEVHGPFERHLVLSRTPGGRQPSNALAHLDDYGQRRQERPSQLADEVVVVLVTNRLVAGGKVPWGNAGGLSAIEVWLCKSLGDKKLDRWFLAERLDGKQRFVLLFMTGHRTDPLRPPLRGDLSRPGYRPTTD